MKLSLTTYLSLLSLSNLSCAGPLKPRDIWELGSPNKLIGSSFGIPGDQTFDYVIVGGGTAGLALAKRLSENPAWSVAVIEAGGFYEFGNGNVSQVALFASSGSDKSTTNYNPVVDWGFVTEPQQGVNNAKVHYARGKCLGGTSARNYMAYQRGTKKTYDLWAEQVGDASYSWASFLPYFQKSVRFTPPNANKRAANATPSYDVSSIGSAKGPVSITFSNYAMAFSSWVQKGLAEIGVDPIAGFTSGKLFGSSYVLATIDAATQIRESSETAFLKPAIANSNLIIFKLTLAKKVKFDANKRATGVVVVTAGKEYTISAKKEVILSAGAFQSPQLLLVSGIGPKTTLDQFNIPVVKALPGVGQNMWDHVFFGPGYRTNVISGSSLGNPQFAAKAVDDLLTKSSGILTNAGGDFFAFEKLPAASRAPLSSAVKAKLATFPTDWPEVEYMSVAGFMGDNSGTMAGPTDAYNYVTVVAALVAPLSRGTISISSADAADPPVIDPRWLTDPVDQAVAIAAYKRVRQLFATTAIKPALIGPEFYPGASVQSDSELLAEIKKAFQTVWHAACTCKMGKSTDPQAVVDSKARVFGVTGLRVVDASAFPLLPPGHPISTIYALAEKIAEDIKNNA